MDAVADSSVPDLYLQVLRMWQADEINVAEEHFATATTKMVLAQLRLRAPMQERTGRSLWFSVRQPCP